MDGGEGVERVMEGERGGRGNERDRGRRRGRWGEGDRESGGSERGEGGEGRIWKKQVGGPQKPTTEGEMLYKKDTKETRVQREEETQRRINWRMKT